jgi:hypothetical protein
MIRAENQGAPLSKEELKQAWKNATPQQFLEATRQSNLLQQQAPFLISEVKRVLQLTNGSITWQQIASQITSDDTVEIISPNTIMNFVMSLPESSYKTTRIHPHLLAHHKKN